MKNRLPLITDYSPSKPIIINDEKIITQGDLLSAAIFLAEKVPDANHYINLCEDRLSFIIGFCAALLNQKPTLLPPNRQPQTIKEIDIEYSNAIFLTDEKTKAKNYFYIPSLDLAKKNHPTTSPSIYEDQIAAIAFTSGSTGKPNANSKKWKTLAGTARLLKQRLFEKNDGYKILATVPSQHMYGLEMTVMMSLCGNCIIDNSHPFFPKDVLHRLQLLSSPSMLVTTPIHLRALNKSELEMPMVKKIVSATAPLDKSQALVSEKIFKSKVVEIYGCTEGGSLATRQTTHNESWQWLKTINIHQTKQETLVSAKHLEGMIHLQDEISIIGDNRFNLLGRSSDSINVAGKRSSISEINNKLLAIDGIIDSHVFLSSKNNTNITRPAAILVTNLSKRTVLEYASKSIDPVFLPRPLYLVEKIPRNATGKITKSSLDQLIAKHDKKN